MSEKEEIEEILEDLKGIVDKIDNDPDYYIDLDTMPIHKAIYVVWKYKELLD